MLCIRVHAGRCRSKQIYEQEMKRGHFELVVDKVVMYGIAGSGKTCSLHVLLGRPPPENRNSTPLMKRPVEVMFMCVNDKKEWKVRTLEEMRDTVAEIIRSRMPKQQTEAQSSGSPASPASSLPPPQTASHPNLPHRRPAPPHHKQWRRARHPQRRSPRTAECSLRRRRGKGLWIPC